ncbi:hypothetical protein JCGZ_16590 [Jatropha curcas]|uniref:PWWP domain-containing protein n=1 Tax=Jatropha curcas TaxID=180498 RepID=A0A067JZ28_JATCU|nr:uncharacterized protein LOC105642299 [Jatropha curcas]KDP29201.1 hypothetical protein JCGZ_16590 [Jatropha curcas]
MSKIKKSTADRQNRKKLDPIDNIPNYPKQQRRPVPKRRSDFSSFFSSSASSISNSGSSQHGLLNATMAGSVDNEIEEKALLELPLIQFKKSADKKSKMLSDFYRAPVTGFDSVAQNISIDQCGDSKQTSATTMESTHEKSQVAESSSICVVPGNVVWAKMDREVWWPAEIVGETASVVDSRSRVLDGRVLVQFYGKHRSAWVDPATDLSQLEDCFEERCCNTMDNFQDALKQALKRVEGLSSREQLIGSPDGSEQPYKQDQSSNEQTSSLASKTGSDFLKTRKGKRKQKPKICSSEATFPPKSAGKVRRFRIMRYLGLIAPVGSPFCLTDAKTAS